MMPKIKDNNTSKTEMELVEQQKHEYKLLASYSRTPGLRLFSFSPMDESLVEVTINYSDTIHLEPHNGRLIPVDKEMQKATVDSRFVYFEALSIKSANKRLNRYRNDLTKLCNLKPVRDGEIKFW